METNPSQSKPELDAILNTIVDGVVVINDVGIIVKYNPACSKIFGYDESEVIGQNIKCLMPSPYKAEHDDYLSNYKSSGIAKIIGIGREVKGARKDGSIFPMYLSVGEFPRSDKKGYVGIIRDMTFETQQQSNYEKLQLNHFHLSRVSAMDQMGAAIAHELNQPLSAVMNYLEAGATILQQGKNDQDAVLEEIMRKSAVQAQRASKILSNLRQFIETGNVDKSVHNLEEVILTAIDLVRPSLNNFGVILTTDIPSDLPPVLISDLQIQQVLVNLLRNASEALEEAHDKHILVSCTVNMKGHVKVGVIDTGVGLSDAQFEKLYEPFTTNKSGGLGVGLSISQSIIAGHEGRIWAEHNTPYGTKFYFTVPCVVEA